MAYCTQGDIEKLFPEQVLVELTKESGDIPDADMVAKVIGNKQTLKISSITGFNLDGMASR